MRALLLIFACKRPKYADTGGKGLYNGQILRTSFKGGPLGDWMKVQITYNTLTVTLNLPGGSTVTEKVLDVTAANTCFNI